MENSEAHALGLTDRRPAALGNFRVLPDDLICDILEYLSPRDVARLACVSSVMYILCNEEPLWMSLCLGKVNGPLQYKGSWKKTALHLENVPYECDEAGRKPLYFDGFNSLFLYRRLYRCHTTLDGFSFDDGNVARTKNLAMEDFSRDYDGKKPVTAKYYQVLLTGLADAWPAKHTWTFDQLLQKYGDTAFIISQKSAHKVSMKFKDYVSYLKIQHDEDPLYIFDHKFGEVAPALLKDYSVPCLFQGDFFDVLDGDKRPPFRWLIIGPQRSGASWHVDPALTSAWNTLLVGHMAPGYRHKGVCRAGLLAHEEGNLENDSIISDPMRKKKRVRTLEPGEKNADAASNDCNVPQGSYQGFSYDINFLAMYLDKERDHYNSPWSSGNCIGQREMREWLFKLWCGKPGMRDLIWKGACLALNAGRWSECLAEICAFHNLPSPAEDERLPVGTGSNPVYLLSDCVVKIFVEEGLETSLYGLGTELEFYNLLCKVNSPLKNHMPDVLESGIIYLENGVYRIVTWDGNTVPDVIARCNLIPEKFNVDGCPFGVWNKKQFNYRKAGMPIHETVSSPECSRIWPYLITKRCKGKIYAELTLMRKKKDVSSRLVKWGDPIPATLIEKVDEYLPDDLTKLLHIFEDANGLNKVGKLCSWIHSDIMDDNIHMEPCGANSCLIENTKDNGLVTNGSVNGNGNSAGTESWRPSYILDFSDLSIGWGDPIPATLIEKVDEYLPDDLTKLLHIFEDANGLNKVGKLCSWIHSDIMDDNIHMEPCGANSCLIENTKDNGLVTNGSVNGNGNSAGTESWRPSYILDFSDLSIGDPIFDIIPIYLDIFRGDARLLKRLLESYKLPLVSGESQNKSVEGGDKFGRLSYHAMCYCILHEENVLGAIFSIWSELKTARTWEEVEQVAWGELNNYKGFPDLSSN
ncbi:hypothetical protein C1H46_001668 [Malus baccata]|uniref:F-box domain-containing protein n=1 Tax=Malus baccata TaxID=106549 RepID=A0A540NNM9_MALBA|nr:hypothetical protein C1H46_001668 [Malus baccata]